MAPSTGPTRLLGALERAVLDALWQSTAPLSVREVRAAIKRRPMLAYTTVMTVLDRLHEKGVVARRMDGRAFLYEPVLSRQSYIGQQAAQALGSGPVDRAVLLAFLDSAERVDPEIVDELSELIRRRRGEGAG